MPRGNPTALLWINARAKRIWKDEYNEQTGKYRIAHKKASADYHREFPDKAPKVRQACKGHKKKGPKKHHK